MKIKLLQILCFYMVLALASCNKCGHIACSTGPPGFTVELIGKETGENVFTSGKYNIENVVVTDENIQPVYTRFAIEDNRNLIGISLPSIAGTKELTLKLNAKISITIVLNVHKGTSNCCTNYFAEKIEVRDFIYERSEETGIIQIKI